MSQTGRRHQNPVLMLMLTAAFLCNHWAFADLAASPNADPDVSDIAHSKADFTLGLPLLAIPVPDREVIELGRQLFFDRSLSVNNTLSCAMCHIPEQGFSQNDLATSVGLRGAIIKRNAPTLLNIAFMTTLFHDGREFSLETQVWSPLLADNEMGNLSIGLVFEKLRQQEAYRTRFEDLLGGISAWSVGHAIASYERTLLAGDSDFDRWYFGGNPSAVSASVRSGFTLFHRHGCSGCHLLEDTSALFTDQLFHNTGIGAKTTMQPDGGRRTLRLNDTLTIETDVVFDAKKPGDLGRYEVTGDPADRWKFRTPGLRNIALTAPYMHDGSFSSLVDVIDYYMTGGFADPDKSAQMQPFTLTTKEKAALIDFLESLTSNGVEEHIPRPRLP